MLLLLVTCGKRDRHSNLREASARGSAPALPRRLVYKCRERHVPDSGKSELYSIGKCYSHISG